MSSVSALTAQFDPNAPLNLELNEITVLMAVNAVGIIAIMALCIYVAASAFFGKSS